MMAHYETNRQVIHLSKAKRCSDQADHLWLHAHNRCILPLLPGASGQCQREV
jgi:hypothetical protein